MSSAQDNKWFIHLNKTSTAKLRLFCFHHAGGTALFFRTWKDAFPPEVELVAVQLPGRETRSSEPFITDINVVTKQITDNFYKYQSTLPFIFFGHSLGSIIAFEVANELQRRHLKIPKYLIVSGRDAPQYQSKEEVLHHLSDDLFIKGLMKYQGMPDEILQHKELLEVLLPRLRADFTLSETYQYVKTPTLECPILALGGKDDPTISCSELADWGKQTSKKCTINLFPGGHFFLNDFKKDIINMVNLIIKNALENHLKIRFSNG